MSHVTLLNTNFETTGAKHIHLTSDAIHSIRNSIEQGYIEHDEAEESIIIGFYGFVHLSNNPESDFEILMNTMFPEFPWSSFNGNIVYDLKTKTLDVVLFLEDYWLCGDASDADPSEITFLELNPGLYESQLHAHCMHEINTVEFLEMFKAVATTILSV